MNADLPRFALYGYWRSSAAYRVRIGLNLKGLVWDNIPVHLLRDGGQQHSAQYRALNPQGLIPVLVHEGRALTQSLAILEYLDELHPQPPLLPAEPLARARARSWAQLIACDIHPLNNLRVLQALEREFEASEAARTAWMRHWMDTGLNALETSVMAAGGEGPFLSGSTPGLADCCLVPQLYNARRFGMDPAPWPRLLAAEQACLALPAFEQARPERQPDAPPTDA